MAESSHASQGDEKLYSWSSVCQSERSQVELWLSIIYVGFISLISRES